MLRAKKILKIPILGITIPNMGTKKVSLSSVLFSKVQQQVLGLLYCQPDRDFYTNEIIRHCDSGTGAVQRELAKLSSAGLITVVEIGNQKRYQANVLMPFYSELRSIILKTFGLADVIKEAIKPLSEKIDIAFIYGSIAKGEDTAKSDIDIMVISDDATYSDFYRLISEAENKLGRKINPTLYSQDEWANKKANDNHFVIKVSQQPKIFLIGMEDEKREFNKIRKNRPLKGRTF